MNDTAFDRFEADGTTWIAGDPYVLSYRSANAQVGRMPEQILADVVSAGLQYAIVADHSPSTGSLEAVTDTSASCFTRDRTEERISCIENELLWNLGPELPPAETFPLRDSDTRALLAAGIQISFSDLSAESLKRNLRTICYIPSDALAVTSSVTDHPPAVLVAVDAQRECRAFSGLPVLVVNAREVTSLTGYHGLILTNENQGYSAGMTAAVQLWFGAIKQGRLPILMGGSGNRASADTAGLDTGPALGTLLTSFPVATTSWESIYNALLYRQGILHSAGTELQVHVYSFGGVYAGTAGAIFTSDLLEPLVRVRGRGQSDSQLFVVGIERGTQQDPGDIRDLRIADPVCAEECMFDLTYEPIQGDNIAYVHIIAPDDFWESPDADRVIEEIAVANPVVFR